MSLTCITAADLAGASSTVAAPMSTQAAAVANTTGACLHHQASGCVYTHNIDMHYFLYTHIKGHTLVSHTSIDVSSDDPLQHNFEAYIPLLKHDYILTRSVANYWSNSNVIQCTCRLYFYTKTALAPTKCQLKYTYMYSEIISSVWYT